MKRGGQMMNTKNIIIGALIIVILTMAVGFSAFATQATLSGTAEIAGVWDVRITGIEVQNISDGVDAGSPEFTNTSATFNAKLLKPGDSVTYAITIENQGTINAKLNNILFTCDEDTGSPAILYKTSELASSLSAGEQTTLTVTIQYDPKTTEVPSVKTKSITGIIEYVQEQ